MEITRQTRADEDPRALISVNRQRLIARLAVVYRVSMWGSAMDGARTVNVCRAARPEA